MAVGTKVGAIRYPFARGRAGAIFILEYTKGTPVTCFGCDRPLVAKQGRRNRWHFAHAVDTNVTCNAETALHRLSKVLVQDGFTYALTNQQPYLLRWRCPSCGEPHVVDATRWWTRVATESSAIIGTRSDVMFEGQRPIAVEIVVTHDVEDETAARYVNADLPVFIVRPTWETVGSLRAELVADDALIVRSEKCPTCREQIETERRHQARLDVLRQRLDEVRMIDDRIVEQRLGDWPPGVDRFGRTLYEGVRRAVEDQAIRLMMIGFTQMQKNRWLFVLHLPGEVGAVYAGLGGTESEPLWASPSPEFWFRLSVDGAHERYGEVVVEFLERHGLRVDEQWRWDLWQAEFDPTRSLTEPSAAPSQP